MKLTKEQRKYLNDKLYSLFKAKVDKLLNEYPTRKIFKISNEILIKLPEDLQKEAKKINQYINEQQEKFKQHLAPYSKAYDEAIEKLLFAENYETVQKLIKDFEEKLY